MKTLNPKKNDHPQLNQELTPLANQTKCIKTETFNFKSQALDITQRKQPYKCKTKQNNKNPCQKIN